MKLWFLDNEENIRAVTSNRGTALPILSAKHVEKLNGENSLEFQIPADHSDAKYAVENGIVLFRDPDGNHQEFVIKEIEKEHGSDGVITRVYAEHVSAELADSFVEKYEPQNRDVASILRTILSGTRWEPGNVEPSGTVSHTFYMKSVLMSLYEILDLFDSEVRFRVQFTGSKVTGRYVDILYRLGKDTGKRFVFSKDLTKILKLVHTDKMSTALVGLGKTTDEKLKNDESEKVTFKDIVWNAPDDPRDKPKNQVWLGDESAREMCGIKDGEGRKLHRIDFIEFPDTEDPEELLEKTNEALNKAILPKVTYDANVIDLEKAAGLSHEAVRIGDAVTVIDRDFVPEISVKARVVELVRDLLYPENSRLVLGNFFDMYSSEDDIERLKERAGTWDGSIQPGDKVKTKWLDGVINAIQNEIYGGAGTIRLQNDGMLILDKPADSDPQRAIILNNGILGISNKRIPGGDPAKASGWEWRTFGTGDGFTADLFNAGTMLSNRIKGGDFVLGGWNGENGRFWMYNADGIVTLEMDGESGTIYEVNIGKLSCPNVTETTTPEQEKETQYLYVNSISGNDVTGEGTSTNPYRTIQRAVDIIPKNNNADFVIYVTTSFNRPALEHLVITGYFGDGSITIKPSGVLIYLYGWVRISSCKHKIEIYNTEVVHDGTGHPRNDDEGAYACVHVIRSETLYMEKCRILPLVGKSKHGIAVSQNSYARFDDCLVLHSESHAVFAQRNGSAYLYDCYGVNPGSYGAYAQTGGKIIITGQNPSSPYAIFGSLGHVHATQTGQYLGPSSFAKKSATVQWNSFSSVYEIRPIASETWRLPQDQAPIDDGSGAKTGLFQGAAYYPRQNEFGRLNVAFTWFDARDFVKAEGKILKEMRIKIKRNGRFGKNKKSELVIFTHDLKRPTGGLLTMPSEWDPITDPEVNPMNRMVAGEFGHNDYCYVALDTDIASRLISGKAKGLLFYSTDREQSIEIDSDSLMVDMIWED